MAAQVLGAPAELIGVHPVEAKDAGRHSGIDAEKPLRSKDQLGRITGSEILAPQYDLNCFPRP